MLTSVLVQKPYEERSLQGYWHVDQGCCEPIYCNQVTKEMILVPHTNDQLYSNKHALQQEFDRISRYKKPHFSVWDHTSRTDKKSMSE